MSILNIKTPMFGVKLCAEADYLKDHYTFGYGISVGQNQWFWYVEYDVYIEVYLIFMKN